MSAKLTWLQAVAHIGGNEDRLSLFLKGDDGGSHPTFDMYLPIADGMLRSAITSRYTPESYDALDSTTIPPYVQFYLFSLLLGAATSHDDARPDSVTTYAGIAAGWLDDVVAGKREIHELTEIASTAGGSGGSIVRVSAPSTTRNITDSTGNTFDSDLRGGIGYRDPRI